MNDLRTIARWMRIVWKDSPLALGGICLLSLLNAMLVVAFPWLWQYVIDALNQPREDTDLQTLVMWMLLVGVGQTMLYIVLQGARSVMNAIITWRARRKVFDHLSRLPPSFYRAWRSGDLVTRLTDDSGEKIAWFLCSGIFRTLEALLIIVVCVSVMAALAPGLTAQVIVPLPLLIVFQAAAQTTLSKRYRRVQQAISTINDALTATFSGIRVIQASRLQAPTRRRFRDVVREQKDAEIRVAYIQQLVFLMYGYGWQIAIVALLLAGGSAVLDQSITLGQFVSFEGFLMTLIWPMFDVGMFASKIKQASVALQRLDDLLSTPAPEQNQPLPAPGARLDVSVQGAVAMAEDGSRLLEDITLHAPAGSTVAVVGQIGAGKSTLMDLLAGQRPINAGTLTIGGVPLQPPWPGPLRRQIGHVPQDTVMISATVKENLLLGRDAAAADIDAALQISRMAQDLPDLPNGLETAVGERGVTLSGGQQQRLAIARALVGRPRILLLDDATAALDADTEAAFWSGLEGAIPGVTVILVTHRVATIQRARQVIVLANGRVAQRGTHDELIRTDGEYVRIYGQLQARSTLGAE